MKDKRETMWVNVAHKGVACGKILCAFLGGAEPHRFALSAKKEAGV